MAYDVIRWGWLNCWSPIRNHFRLGRGDGWRLKLVKLSKRPCTALSSQRWLSTSTRQCEHLASIATRLAKKAGHRLNVGGRLLVQPLTVMLFRSTLAHSTVGDHAVPENGPEWGIDQGEASMLHCWSTGRLRDGLTTRLGLLCVANKAGLSLGSSWVRPKYT